MKIYIDADACPVVSIAEKVAAKFQIPVTLLCDTNHILQSDYSDVIVVDAGADAVDYKLISLCTKDDVVQMPLNHQNIAACLSENQTLSLSLMFLNTPL